MTKMNTIVRGDRHMSIRMIAEIINANKETSEKFDTTNWTWRKSVQSRSQKNVPLTKSLSVNRSQVFLRG